jgi:hypothetical protein
MEKVRFASGCAGVEEDERFNFVDRIRHGRYSHCVHFINGVVDIFNPLLHGTTCIHNLFGT